MDGLKAPVRLGIIGIGFGQQAHVPAFLAAPGCRVVALCASTRDRAAAVADRLGIPGAYGDWRDVVDDSGIDAVTIAVPPALQPEIALAAMERGKAVFCEKPMATSRETAELMALRAEQSGAANMLDFELPEIAAWRKAKAFLDDEGIGSLRHIGVSWHVETYANRKGLSSWKTDIAMGGGTLNAFVSHVFHYIEWFAGPVRDLSASLFRAPGDERPGDTLVTLALTLETGVPVSISVSSNAFLGNGHRVAFYGDEGTLVLENGTADYARGFHLLRGGRQNQCLEEVELDMGTSSPGEDGRVLLVARLASRFIDWVQNGVPSRPDFADGLRVQKLIDAALRSHDSGCRVRGPL